MLASGILLLGWFILFVAGVILSPEVAPDRDKTLKTLCALLCAVPWACTGSNEP